MKDPERSPVLYVIVCAAGPASYVSRLVRRAQHRGWNVCVIPTPAAVDFIDTHQFEDLTGHRVRSTYRKPSEPGKLPQADAIIVAPALQHHQQMGPRQRRQLSPRTARRTRAARRPHGRPALHQLRARGQPPY